MDIETLVLYQDSCLLAVNKPAGLPTLVDGYHPDAPYLTALLMQRFAPLWVVHRLDRETSGVILFALSAMAHRNLNTQFEQRRTLKTYHALVDGSPDWEERSVDLALRPDGDRRHRTVVDSRRGRPAQTDLRVLRRFACRALVEAVPRTGRTHQIRAHLAAVGAPILGDRLYGDTGSVGGSGSAGSVLIERTALHAVAIEVAHPEDGRSLRFTAPYPTDFERALEAAARQAAPGMI